MLKKIISLFLSLSLIITQPIFAQGVAQLNLAQYLGQARLSAIDNFRPTQLRYFSYDNLNDSFRILLDKGDAKDIKDNQLKEEAKELMDYFLIGLTLPNDAFWVNLRPDSPDNIIDPELEKTDLGRILLEADLQLKKDTAGLTSPQTPEGKAYWDKLYKKAGELFGTENITIPTITRPWIVPGEIIVRESHDSAYIYKATLKVLLEQDHLKDSSVYNFSDPRLKELNEYSSQIIRETIIPKLTQEVNSSKRYAQLRQVYYSLVLSRWFKQKYSSLRSTRASAHQGTSADYISLIDSGNLTNLIAKEAYDKLTYFKQYRESFAKGEYNLKEPVYTPYGQSIRTYMSGGFSATKMTITGINTPKTVGSPVEKQLVNNVGVVLIGKEDGTGLIFIKDPKQPLALAASPLNEVNKRNALLVQDFIAKSKNPYSLFTYADIYIRDRRDRSRNSVDKYIDLLRDELKIIFRNSLEGNTWEEVVRIIQTSLNDHARPIDQHLTLAFIGGIIAYYDLVIFYDVMERPYPEKAHQVIKHMRVLLADKNNSFENSDEYFKDFKYAKEEEKFLNERLGEFEIFRHNSNYEIPKEEHLLVLAYEASEAEKKKETATASPLTVGMVKSTIKTNMDAFFLNIRKTYKKKDGKDWDKELKELYDSLDSIDTYEKLTNWIDKAMNFFEKKYGAAGPFASMIKNLTKIKEEISQQKKPHSVGSPLGKKLPVTDIYGRPLRYVYYWKLSDGEKNSLRKAFEKSFAEWEIKAADKNLRFAVRVNGANKIVAVVGALQYNIATKEAGIIIVPEGVNKALEDKALKIKSSLRKTYIEEIRQGARFWDNTFSSAVGSPLEEFVIGGVNSNETIDASEEIGWTRIEEIKYRGRPEVYGSLSKSSDFKKILKKDNTFVLGKNLSHQRLAGPLLKVLVDSKVGKESFEYNNQKFTIETIYERAWSIFNDKGWTNLRYIVTNTITRKTISFSGLLPYYINDYGFYGGDEAFRLEPKAIIDFFGITASSGLTSESRPSVPFGGIDFTGRAMRIGLEPMGSFADLKLVLPEVANAAAIDLDAEFKQIQLMASSGIRPSDNRILEFAAACYYRGEFGPRLGEITSCLQQAHFLDERLGRESSEALRLATMLLEVM